MYIENIPRYNSLITKIKLGEENHYEKDYSKMRDNELGFSAEASVQKLLRFFLLFSSFLFG